MYVYIYIYIHTYTHISEDSWCRAVCILIFVITIANDLKGTIGRARQALHRLLGSHLSDTT